MIIRLVELTQSKNENVALAVCKVLLNKTLSDIKSVEVTQSSVMDSLILEEVGKYQPQSPTNDKLDLANITTDEKARFAQKFIEVGLALLGQGKYGVPIVTGEQLGARHLS